MSVFEVTTTITHKYLMGKTKSELAYMYLDLMGARLENEAAFETWRLNNLERLAQAESIEDVAFYAWKAAIRGQEEK